MTNRKKKKKVIKAQFVEFIPEEIIDGILYISIPFATATHNCACGCGQRVVTPIKPSDWSILWDGESVTLDPSIGNWSFPCKSHYWIRRNEIIWARKLGFWEIQIDRDLEEKKRAKYYKTKSKK